MSCSLWAYSPEKCDYDYCPGDCDHCGKAKRETLQFCFECAWFRDGKKGECYRLASIIGRAIETRPTDYCSYWANDIEE